VRAPESWRAALEVLSIALPFGLLAALGGVVRSMQAGKCGFKAVAVASISSLFAGLITHLLLAQTEWPLGVQAALVGLSGYASGELLKIWVVRVCKWAETVTPGGK